MSLATHVLFPSASVGRVNRIVLLHGFTQNSQCWGPFAEHLATQTGFEVVAIDAPGHGDSPPDHDGADLWAAAELIADAGGRAHYVGYSMGGRMGLHLALRRPEVVQSLTLIGSTPGIADSVERDARKAADASLADRLTEIGLSQFLDDWLAQPLFASLSREASCRDQRLRNRVEGLATNLRNCGTGSQDNLWPQLSTLAIPLACIVGANDAKFLAIAEQIGNRMTAYITQIADAGHSAHLEQPAASAAAVAAAMGSSQFLPRP